jgi:protoporphyrinogen oxidase
LIIRRFEVKNFRCIREVCLECDNIVAIIGRNELADVVINDLIEGRLLNIEDEILFTDVRILDPAYIIYDHKHRTNVNMIHDFFRKNHIFPCGRFGDWEYLNIDHAILSGRKISEAVLRNEQGINSCDGNLEREVLL